MLAVQQLEQTRAAQQQQESGDTLTEKSSTERSTNRVGQATEAEGGALVVGPLGDQDRKAGASTAVFGASLFTGQAATTSDAPNPNYILSPGDRVSVRTWGGIEAETVAVVDPDGNLFLPSIGPLKVAGTRAGDLQHQVEAEVRKKYTSEVQVYVVVLSTHRIGVFVTGFVRKPGRFGGSASDSVLDFLVRAAGVDPGRGSFRNIDIQRGGHRIATVDLYDFLLSGRLPPVSLQEGDTILVNQQSSVVGVDGSVRDNYLFELPGRVILGRELIDLARPLPAATHVVVRGTRNKQPFARYSTVAEFAAQTLQDQDTVSFITDAPAQTVRILVEGSRLGPSVLVADRNTKFCQVLDYIAVDPALADIKSIFLLRPRIAEQQKRVINEAMDRLERQLFTAVSATTGVATIRAQEAQLVSSYISRARRIQPEGRLVVTDRLGNCSDVRLEEGDTIVIPESSQTVLVSGEVMTPVSVVWRANYTYEDYLKAAGGLTQRGSTSDLMVRHANGEVELDPQGPLRPGDELIALPELDPKYFQITRDLFDLLYEVALSATVLP